MLNNKNEIYNPLNYVNNSKNNNVNNNNSNPEI